MRGVWRPLAVYGGTSSALLAGHLAARGANPSDPSLWAIALIVPLLLAGALLPLGLLPPGRFLAGLRDAGAAPEVLEDEVGWWGARRIRCRTAGGIWEIVSAGGLKPRVEVRGPGSRSFVGVTGGARRAGREAGGAAVNPTPRRARARSRPASEGTRPRPALAAACIVAGLALAFTASYLARTSAGAIAGIAGASVWLGLGISWFVAVVIASVAAWTRWTAHLEELGRRGAAAMMLTGAGAGASLIGLTWGAILLLGGEAPGRSLAGAALGVLGASAGAASLSSAGSPTRAILTLGAAATGGAAVLLRPAFFAAVTMGLALLVLFQAWTTAPPTEPEVEAAEGATLPAASR